MNTTYFLITFMTTLAILAALGIGIAWLFARNFCKPQRRLPKKTPAQHGLDYEDITFPSQGATLNGWFIPGQHNISPRPAIVVAHGWSANAAQVMPIAKHLHEAGCHVLLYNARSHGTSDEGGPITLQKFAEDLMAAIDYLENRPDVDMEQLGVVGHSMGGSSAILATSMDKRIRALVSSAAFADPVALTKEYMRKHHLPLGPLFHLVQFFINLWLDTTMSDIAPQNRIGRIDIPILLIHGDADAVISPMNMELLQSHASHGNVQTWLMSGGLHHSTIIRDPAYGPRIVEFLEENLFVERLRPITDEENLVFQFT